MKRLLLFFFFAMLLTGCGGRQPTATQPPAEAASVVIADASRMLERGSGKLVEGDQAPDFSFTLADGTTRTLGDLRGTPVVLNFWATWCLPCIEEMPVIQQAYAEAGGKLAVLAVNRNELPEAIGRFAPSVEVTFPLIANIAGDIGDRYGVTSLPVTYFINSDGTIAARHIGALSEQLLAERLSTLQ